MTTTFPQPCASQRVETNATSVATDAAQPKYPAQPEPAEHKGNGYDHLAPLFDKLVDESNSDEQRQRVREQLICGYMSVAEHIARRFAKRGLSLEDLTQVARLGLVNAVDRFDPSRGKDFLSYAVPTITGEVRRHFRDHGWAMRVPRRLQELRSSINKASTQLSQQLGRAPTASELAGHLGVDVEEIHEGYHVGTAYSPSSLESLTGADDESTRPVRDFIGGNDDRFSTVDNQSVLTQGLAQLPERQRTILGMRFFWNLTQSQIAERMNLSQMHVSRLLARSLATLRESITDEDGHARTG